jgi:hypothetical protein
MNTFFGMNKGFYAPLVEDDDDNIPSHVLGVTTGQYFGN